MADPPHLQISYTPSLATNIFDKKFFEKKKIIRSEVLGMIFSHVHLLIYLM